MKEYLPIILGSDENAYAEARLFSEITKEKPLLLCTRQLIPTMYSSLFRLEIINSFDNDSVFPDALKKVLIREKKNYEKILVVPCSDYYLALLSKHYDYFDGMIENKFISYDLLTTLDTKDKFYMLCDKYNLTYPKTYVATKENRESAIDNIPFDFPIVMKPENSNAYEYLHSEFEGKKKVYYFATKEEYLTLVNSMNKSSYNGNLILQEFIEGGDDSMRVVNAYVDSNSKVKAISLGQPVLEEYAPKTLGNYAAIVTRYDKEILDKIKGFLEEIKYVGFANFDIKYSQKTGKYYLFEINPRLGRSSFSVRAAGLNMMKVLVDTTIYNKDEECIYTKDTALWSNVPKIVLKKYVKNEELKKEIFDLIKKKKYIRTLVCDYDKNIKRTYRITRYYFSQYRNFEKYYFDKTIEALTKL